MALTIAITGATGFVGGHVLAALQGRGHRLRVLCRRPEALAGQELELVEGDLTSFDAAAFLEGADVLLHMAGAIKALDRQSFFAVNRDGTGRLAAAAALQSRSPRVLLLSSLAARVPQLSDYAASKRAGEERLREEGERLDWQILRAPAVYGPGDRATLDIFKQMKRGFCLVPGWGRAGPRARFSLICVIDLAAALVALIEAQELGKGTFELDDGTPQGYDWPALAAAGGKAFGRPVRLWPMPRFLLFALAGLVQGAAKVSGKAQVLTPGKVREFCHDDWVAGENLLQEAVDWRPRLGLEEGFAETVAWYNAQGWL